MTVSISYLKARLSEVLRHVRGGGEVIITDRGQAVARLAPLSAVDQGHVRLNELIDSGLVRPGKGSLPKSFAQHALPSDPEGSVRETILDERKSGR